MPTHDILAYQPPYPHDHQELRSLEELARRLPEFEERLRRFRTELQDVSKAASDARLADDIYQLESMVLRPSFAPLEHRQLQRPTIEFARSLRASIKVEGIVRGRRVPCEVCGENRSTDRCHIIPRRLGGHAEASNILILCPSHHRLFDRFMLSRAEFATIDWSRKSEASQKYVELSTLPSHQSFWARLDEGVVGEFRPDHWADKDFIAYACKQVQEVLLPGEPVKRAAVYRVVAPELRELAKSAVREFVASGVARQTKVGSTNVLIWVAEGSEIPDEVVHSVWSRTA